MIDSLKPVDKLPSAQMCLLRCGRLITDLILYKLPRFFVRVMVAVLV